MTQGFEYYQNTLCVQPMWIVEQTCLTYANYKNLVKRNLINVVRRGCRNTPALVEYDSLPERFKSEVKKVAGDPYQSTKRQLFKDYLINDLEAVKFYNNFTLDNGDSLPQEKIAQYVAEAIILNGVDTAVKKTKSRQSALGGKVGELWDRLSEIIQDLPQHTYPHSLPSNTRSLRNKFRSYKKEGYQSLIHKGYCNKNSEKINTDAQFWVVARWGNQVEKCANIAQLLQEYNAKAAVEGWKPLKEERTLRLFLDQPEKKVLWYGHRYGELKAKEKYTAQLSTKMPTMRDSLWYSDGTKLNYFFLDNNGKIATCQVYEVMDAFSEVLLGYHISPTENMEAQYHAYKMAVKMAEHRPYQIGFDGQGGHNKLEAGKFLTKLARLSIKAQPYNGKSKTIESAFGRFQQQFLKRDWFFTGQNITAKRDESKANREFILANKENLPTLEEIKEVYKQRRLEWNSAPHHKTKQPRINMYRESKNPKAPAVDLMEMVDLFWVERKHTSRYTAYGLSFKENKQEYTYMVQDNGVPDMEFLRKNIDKKFIVKFDPEDMSMIYLYEKSPLGLRFVTEATTKIQFARNKQEQDEIDSKLTALMLANNKESRVKTRNEMEQILKDHGMSAEDYGLNIPAIKGIESSKRAKTKKFKKVQPMEIGEVLKAESNEDVNLRDLY